MDVARAALKDAVLEVLDELPTDQVTEVLDFALFLKQRRQAELQEPEKPVVKSVPAAHLDKLVGLVAWGGDALADTERLYET